MPGGTPHVAIAGAGIGGLAAALALSGAGCHVTLYERAPSPAEAGAGLQLSPNACAALRRLGVLAEVQAEAVAIEALRIGRGRDGAALTRLPLGGLSQQRFGAPFLVSRRADLHRVLRRAAERTPGITLATGATLTGWKPVGEALELVFAGLASPGARADALVGADGLHSVVRRKLTGPSPADPARGTAWRTMIEAEALPELFREPCSNLWLGRGAHLVHYPVARGRLVNVVAAVDHRPASGPAQDKWASPGDPAEIKARFARWAEPIRRLIDCAPAWGKWPLIDRRPLPRWSHGRVTLLGDAAHPMLPFLAQGAAQALEDATALGDAVAAQPRDLPSAFQAYQAARRARTGRIQAESRRQALIYHLPWPASSLRDAVLKATPARRLLARYDWLYASGGPRIPSA